MALCPERSGDNIFDGISQVILNLTPNLREVKQGPNISQIAVICVKIDYESKNTLLVTIICLR